MSRSPADADGESDAYHAGWSAISRLIRQGYSWSGHERNNALLNTGDGRFADVSAAAGLDFPDDGRALALVDWDLDGDLDLLFTNRTGPRVRLMRNDLARPTGEGRGFVALKVVGTTSNRDGIGARVEVHLSDGAAPKLVATRRAGEGFLAQSSSWLHFGLGGGEVERVVVRWPSGGVEDFGPLERDRRYRLVEGDGRAREWTPPSEVAGLQPRDPDPTPATGRGRVVLAYPIPMPTLRALTAEGQTASFLGIGADGPKGTGRPLLLNLWGSFCAPCLKELADFGAAEEEVRAAGIDVVALSVDAPEDRATARSILDSIAFPYTAGFASPETIEVLDTLQAAVLDREERTPVPTSFLVDGSGRLVAFYLGPVEPATVLADLRLTRVDPVQRRALATPFPGRWLSEPDGVNLASLEARFNRRGLARAAGELALGQLEVRKLSEAQLQHEFGVVRARQEQWDTAIRHFQSAVELDPYFFEAYEGLGYCLQVEGRHEAAIAAYEKAKRLEPGHERTLFNLALCHLELRDIEAVARELHELILLESELVPELEERIRNAGDDR